MNDSIINIAKLPLPENQFQQELQGFQQELRLDFNYQPEVSDEANNRPSLIGGGMIGSDSFHTAENN